MRYYKVVLTSPNNNDDSTASSGKSLNITTHPNGVNQAPDMGALHVVFDIPVTSFDMPNGNAYLEIRGVDIHTISQASNFQGYTVKVYGGMGTGYDLAKPEQSGLLIIGTVFQAYGNWEGPNMSLNLLIQPYSGAQSDISKPFLVWHWAKGQDIKDAINKCITTALPNYKCEFNLKSPLIGTHDDLGFYDNLSSLADVIVNASKSVNQDTGYNGIRFFIAGKNILFYDNASGGEPKKIEFNDLIGQPTWLGPVLYPRIMLQTVMRADLTINDVITMPLFNQQGSKTLSGYGTIAPTSQDIQTPKDRSLFQGNFVITGLRHIGDSRNPDGSAWVTVIEAVKDES